MSFQDWWAVFQIGFESGRAAPQQERPPGGKVLLPLRELGGGNTMLTAVCLPPPNAGVGVKLLSNEARGVSKAGQDVRCLTQRLLQRLLKYHKTRGRDKGMLMASTTEQEGFSSREHGAVEGGEVMPAWVQRLESGFCMELAGALPDEYRDNGQGVGDELA